MVERGTDVSDSLHNSLTGTSNQEGCEQDFKLESREKQTSAEAQTALADAS